MRKVVRFLSKQGHLLVAVVVAVVVVTSSLISFKGQAIKHTTVKWSIHLDYSLSEAQGNLVFSLFFFFGGGGGFEMFLLGRVPANSTSLMVKFTCWITIAIIIINCFCKPS